MTDDAPPANVLRPTFGQQSAIERTYSRLDACRHRSYKLEPKARTVSCGACGALLDAFGVLLEYADKERNWRHWDQQRTDQEKRLTELKDEERRVKARTTAASRKDAAAAVAHERLSSLVRRQAIADKAKDIAESTRQILRLARLEPEASVAVLNHRQRSR